MDLIGLNSRYARLGIFLGSSLLFFSGNLRNNDLTHQENSIVLMEEDYDYTAILPFEDLSDVLASEEPVDTYTSPCYLVEFAPELLEEVPAYRSDLFGTTPLDTRAIFKEDLQQALTAEFETATWRDSKDCFSGSFIVSFTVDENGLMGPDMLAHHMKGGGNTGGKAVLNVLTEMKHQGYVWTDGGGNSGEIRIPLRFRLN